MMMGQWMFICCKKCNTGVEDITIREAMHVGGEGRDIQEISVLFTQL
jgi:hypothetical protein